MKPRPYLLDSLQKQQAQTMSHWGEGCNVDGVTAAGEDRRGREAAVMTG